MLLLSQRKTFNMSPSILSLLITALLDIVQSNIIQIYPFKVYNSVVIYCPAITAIKECFITSKRKLTPVLAIIPQSPIFPQS